MPSRDRPESLDYSPDADGNADPGEIVWAWVPYEDDPTRGKDRPLLVIGRTGPTLRALMLSSKTPHDNERDDWLRLGTGPWDREGRVSYLRLDRLFELGEHDIRREGLRAGGGPVPDRRHRAARPLRLVIRTGGRPGRR
ncbi:MAG TPA: type II toxin-antitoxin system PemK/MazF family toxin [Pseudonocardiaceae bacterium]|nr:type II toxin-antitoxin system PemK/MazF family toxin [Pseudonocardiaceae bacterium]